MEKKEFTAAALDLKYEPFIVYVVLFHSTLLTHVNIYPSYKSQIVGLIAKKDFIKISTKYANFADVFFLDLNFKLCKHTGIDNHAIELVDS